MNSLIPKKFFIDGPAGKLETVLAEPDSIRPCGIAVIAHPHPLYAGTMDNKVVHTLFKALLELEYVTVRFNFRGVGQSAGTGEGMGEGTGETEDMLAVTEAVRQQFQAQSSQLPLVLAGFSFGGAIAARAAQQLGAQNKPQKLILVAPSVDRLHAPAVVEHAASTLIVHGDQDEVVPLQSVLDWAAPQELPVVVIPGGEHFFHGRLPLLKRIVLESWGIKCSG